MNLNAPFCEIINDDSVGEWKIQLPMQIISFLLTILEKLVQWTQRGSNIETMMGSEIDDIVKELFESFLQRYREELE